MKSIAKSLAVAALLALTACASSSGVTRTDEVARCDRACLNQTIRTYLQGMQSGDWASAHLARDFRATRNGAEIASAELARSFTALGDVQRFYADPVNGQAAYLGLLQEQGGVALTAIRIRVEGGAITEAEQFLARPGDTLFSAEGFAALPPRLSPVSSARPSREEMVAAANSYFEGLSRHDSTIIRHVAGCERLENGTRVTNRPPRQPANAVEAVALQARDCGSGMESMTQIREVALRRYPLVDEEANVVMGIGLFLRPPGQTGNFSRRNLLTEFFELNGGEISAIYAVMHYIGPEAPESTGWQ